MIIPIKWQDHRVWMLDQRQLPWREVWRQYTSYRQVAQAIKVMVIRGAPAIGVAAAMGYALGALQIKVKDGQRLLTRLVPVKDHLAKQRPTAVNLVWALNRMESLVKSMIGQPVADIQAGLVQEAVTMQEEDIAINRRMGQYGAELVPEKATILTHCNAGALATGGYGTALGVVRAAIEAGKQVQVLADETRPFLQGARLTAWELMKDNIPVQVITDNMAGHFLKQGRVDLVVVGADRIAANGDTANKIGTYSVAVLAKENHVPFYVAAPLSTIDLNTDSGQDIPIEERPDQEITHVRGRQITPAGVEVLHPAFDVTPNGYLAGIITEKGVARKTYRNSLKKLFQM